MRWRRSRIPRWRPYNNSNTCLRLCTITIGRSYTVFCLVLGVFLSSLVGEMEGKERES